jgi:ubiquinol-cytochrome c reductase iron-sulfur subunit
LAAHTEDGSRRDFLVVAANAFAAVGGAAMLWPLVQQMNPDAAALALASVEVDVSKVAVGQAITVMWRGKPVFIRNRTPEEIKLADEITRDNLGQLKDAKARNEGVSGGDSAPAVDDLRTVKGKRNWLVLVGVCTHLGCIPKGQALGDSKGDYKGWFCPCHGSHYDTSGRIRKGPAPENLKVPPYGFVTDTKIKIG